MRYIFTLLNIIRNIITRNDDIHMIQQFPI